MTSDVASEHVVEEALIRRVRKMIELRQIIRKPWFAYYFGFGEGWRNHLRQLVAYAGLIVMIYALSKSAEIPGWGVILIIYILWNSSESYRNAQRFEALIEHSDLEKERGQ